MPEYFVSLLVGLDHNSLLSREPALREHDHSADLEAE
jgi:hypothetical protein